MKNLVFSAIFAVVILCSCSSDDVVANPFIPNVKFDTGSFINTNLPQFNNLIFPGNYELIGDQYGINGVVLYYAGGNQYSAFELSDPNHTLNSCSKLVVENAVATCSCDDGNSYDIVLGVGFDGTTGNHSLKRYFVEANGNIIRVFNN